MRARDAVRAVPARLRRLGHRSAIELERRWDASRLTRAIGGPPEHFRIVSYFGYGAGDRIVVRGRVVDNAAPPAAVEGERMWAAVRRTVAIFSTNELPGVPLHIRVGAAEARSVTDDEGYFRVQLDAALAPSAGPWADGTVTLAVPYRGLLPPEPTAIRIRVPGPEAAFGVISDVDDTVLHTGAQRTIEMLRLTVAGSALTRTPLVGAPQLYQSLVRGQNGGQANPVFYVSSSPWNVHDYLTGFLEHRGLPLGPLLLRDLLGSDPGRGHGASKHESIAELLDLHPKLPFVLIGDSGQEDPRIYAEVVRRNPGRILAVYIREVRLDPADGRVETITDIWDDPTPFVLSADSAAIARHAAGLGLLSSSDAALIERVTAAATA